jgi:pimeloyl-ACP methyl ester carboxylesterase
MPPPTLPPTRSLVTDAGRLCWREAGAGPALVFLHGLLGSSASWRYQFAALAPQARVIAWDAPGYGGSDPLPTGAGEPDLAAYAAALAILLRHLGAGDITLVGHSFGGVLAAAVAAAGDPPLARLVLSCTHAGNAEPAGSPPSPRLQERLRELASLGPQAYGARRAEAMVAPGASAETRALVAAVAGETRPEGLFAATRALQFANVRPLLPRLTLPTLVLSGAEDPVVAPERTAELRALTPFARHVTLPGVGHAPYLEDPATYNAALAEFLATAGPARRP